MFVSSFTLVHIRECVHTQVLSFFPSTSYSFSNWTPQRMEILKQKESKAIDPKTAFSKQTWCMPGLFLQHLQPVLYTDISPVKISVTMHLLLIPNPPVASYLMQTLMAQRLLHPGPCDLASTSLVFSPVAYFLKHSRCSLHCTSHSTCSSHIQKWSFPR